ncbi:AraC family transcriptional regulator [Ottowia testudinis]|uniref:AraC family transcriptional regulator n=1 Tax=Ottowia testudinis TaxID=2816950 RepID=A0A975CGU5_9BURK|nr:GyrI-like domain-containing protein [Ottowia testudinis]QTD43919.1 AraC family transcriptional regulator [Ottowia testudinis]
MSFAPEPPPADYQRRIDRVIDYIGTHLGDALDLATLAEVAHFSPWHFHRVFQAMTGETLADCVRRMRLQAAAQRLVRRPREPALAIALEVGFGSAEVFSRAFKAHFGTTPTAWRRGGWRAHADARQAALRKIHQAERKNNQDAARALTHDAGRWPLGLVNPKGIDMHVEIKQLPAMRLAYLRHTGPYGQPGIPQTWDKFVQWCGRHGLLQPRRLMLGIGQDNPEVTPADKLRYDCCVQVDAPFVPPRADALPVGVQDFAAGRFACARFAGLGHDLGAAWEQLYGQWLPASGHEPAHRPGLELYDDSFTLDEKTGAFTCWLCVPIGGINT